MDTGPSTITASPRSGRGLALLGFLLAIVGLGSYIALIAARRLVLPWYLPVTATLGVLLVAASLWRARSGWRIAALIAVFLLAGMEWMFVFATRLPAYTGPVAVGKPFLAFTSVRADGTAFTERDLRDEQTTVLVFFRGRW